MGVNFGGYSAGVGFGPNGLSASAGTPYGQAAEAGLGGTVDGNVAGGLRAGATAGNGVGASASLGGDVNSGIGVGQAESHAGGVQKSVVKTVCIQFIYYFINEIQTRVIICMWFSAGFLLCVTIELIFISVHTKFAGSIRCRASSRRLFTIKCIRWFRFNSRI